MKPYPKKFQFKVGKSTRQYIILNINNIKIRESSSVFLLDSPLTIDLLLRIILTYYAVEPI